MTLEKISDITCGILFKKSFRIMDIWGSLVDKLLINNPYFSTDYFPSISSRYMQIGALTNEKLGHSLRLSSDNLIYCHAVQEDFSSEYSRFCERIEKYLIPEIIYKHHLDVIRLGVVFTYKTENAEMARYISKYFKTGLDGISDFRFSKKEPTKRGLLLSEREDYINKIFTFGSISDNQIGITYDYQLHFVPPREYVNNEISGFLTSGFKAFQEDLATEV